ncbi:MAG: hypothetical protein ACPF8V_08770, partial [Luteibaculum sp.]
MKNLFRFAIAAVVATSFIACDDLKDSLPDIEIPVNQETSITLDIPVGDTAFVYNKEESIAAVKELQDNADKLKSIDADSVTYKFSDLTGGAGGDGSNASFEGEIETIFGDIGAEKQLA